MNKLNLIVVLALLFSFSIVNAQNNDHKHDDDHHHDHYDSGSKFSIITYGGIGHAVIDNDNQPNYNLNANIADILVSYRIGERLGLSTGIGFNRLTGDGFNNANENFYHERGTLKIPLLLSINFNLSPKVRLVSNIGFYTQTVTRDKYSFAGRTVKDVYGGWNFGLQSGIGLAYNYNKKIGLGIMFNNQGDFNRLESDASKGITDEQKISGINTISLLFTIDL